MKNLIGISGKIGSGKDTVGAIIMALTGTGFGDNKEFEIFKKTGLMPISTNKSPFVVKKFAGKLKDIVCMLIGCTREELEDADFKNTPLDSSWDESHGINTPRELLQIVGTNCGRDMIHTNIWCNALFADYRPLDDTKRASMGNVIDYSDCPFPSWLLTDMRFPNELEAVKSRNGLTIRVNRPRVAVVELADGTKRLAEAGEAREHESETALDDAEFDYTIDNSGTYLELIEKVRDILISEEIIVG